MDYIARGILSPNLIRSCPAVNAQFWSGCHFPTYSFYGDTDLGPAIDEALRMLQTEIYSLADVLVVSDFEVGNLSSASLAMMTGEKRRNVRFHSLQIERHGESGGTRRIRCAVAIQPPQQPYRQTDNHAHSMMRRLLSIADSSHLGRLV